MLFLIGRRARLFGLVSVDEFIVVGFSCRVIRDDLVDSQGLDCLLYFLLEVSPRS